MIGIVCGDGDYPRLIAKACTQKKIDFCLIFMEGFCSLKNWPKAEYTSANLGEIGKILDFLHKNRVEKVVFAGRIKRPNFNQLSLDKKGKQWLRQLGKAIFAGDDTLLRAFTNLVQNEGFVVIAGTSLLDDIFLGEGVFSRRKPSASDLIDVDVGVQAAKELGLSDLGQSVLVSCGRVLGREDVHGTNALIETCGQSASSPGGVLVKISKPQQDNRLDLPTIGVETIEKLHKNGFNGVALEAGRCIVLDKDDVIKRSDELNMFLVAIRVSPLKIFMIAGEASGDYLGGKLIEDIREISRGAKFLGVGGKYMAVAGQKQIFSINELSIIGIWEVISKIFHVKRLIRDTVKAILDYQPNVVVTIDSSGFTHRVDREIKKMQPSISIVHYVAPPVWAWRRWRAKSLYKFLDKLLVLLPFEPPYFSNVKTVFVGHPIAIDADFDKPNEEALKNFSAGWNEERIITLLPGSRMSEIRRHMPILGKFVSRMMDRYGKVRFIIPTVESLQKTIEEMTSSWPRKPFITTKKSQKVLAYYSSDLAVAASGTVTLELARVRLPFVAIYRTSLPTYLIVKFLVKVRYVCLVNLLAKRDVVPELLQYDCTADNIVQQVEKILHPKESDGQKKAFTKVIELLKTKPKLAAREVIEHERVVCNR